MYLENVVLDAVDPRRLGRFWEEALGCERLTDEEGGYETRLAVEGGPVLDLCFPTVPEAPSAPGRVRLVVEPTTEPPAVLTAIQLDSADPARDVEFWAWLTGWERVAGAAAPTLRHPSGRGAVLELCPEPVAKGEGKNPVHLDVRLEPGEEPDGVAASIAERGGAPLHRPEWGELPWRPYTDPSGNEFCVLPAPTA